MELIKLGRKSKGVKYFSLTSNDQFGYNVECSDRGGIVRFNNLQVIEWLYQGKTVFTTPEIIKGQPGQNFSRYLKVTITKAKKIEPEKLVHEHNEQHLNGN